MNAIAGWLDLGKMGVDAVHNNLHKTWTIPHGGGGPGDAIVAVSERLVDYLPGHQIEKRGDGTYAPVIPPKSIGTFHRHWGNFAHKVRAYTYLLRLGREGVRRMAAVAVLSARYLHKQLGEHYPSLPAGADSVPRMHEFILTLSEEDYPAELVLREASFPLKYRFAPGEVDDGISVQVPVGALPAVVGEALDWSVPGMFPAVCEQWLKSLPKSKRRPLTPIPDTVAELLPLLLRDDRYRQGRLSVALAQVVQDLYGVRIAADDWDRDRIDAHLKMNVQVVDADGRLLEQGRDVAALQAHFASTVRERVQGGAVADLERTELTRFPDDVTLADTRLLEDGRVVVYPALVDRGTHVDLKALPTAAEQRRENPRGYARLALLNLGQSARHLKKRAEREQQMGLHYAALGNARELQDELLRGAAWYCFFAGRPLPVTAQEFEQRVRELRGAITTVFEETLTVLRQVLAERFDVARRLEEMTSPAFAEARADAAAQLARLVPADVLSATPREYLAELPRYLAAVRYRIEHLQGRVAKDAESLAVVQAFEARLERIAGASGVDEDEYQRLRFSVEELRVALFAEPVGTRGKVSPKRLAWEFLDVERSLGLA